LAPLDAFVPPEKKPTAWWKSLLGLIAIVFVWNLLGRPDDSSSPSAPTPPREIVRYTANELYDAYASNEVATDIALKGKIVEVSGTVKSIDKSIFDSMYVSLVTRNQFESASMRPDSSEESKVAALRKGQFIVLRCTNMGRTLGSPSGRGCSIVSVQ
jgi:tRNA_anti-like